MSGALPDTRRMPRPTKRELLVRVVERVALTYRGTGSSLMPEPESVARAFVGGCVIHLGDDGTVKTVAGVDCTVDWPLVTVAARDIHQGAARVLNHLDESGGPR